MNVTIYDHLKKRIGTVINASVTISDDNGVIILGIWSGICPFNLTTEQNKALLGLSCKNCYGGLWLKNIGKEDFDKQVRIEGTVGRCEDLLTEVELNNFRILFKTTDAGEKPISDREIAKICSHSYKDNTYSPYLMKVIDEIIRPLVEKGFLQIQLADEEANSGLQKLTFLRKPETEIE